MERSVSLATDPAVPAGSTILFVKLVFQEWLRQKKSDVYLITRGGEYSFEEYYFGQNSPLLRSTILKMSSIR